VSRAARTRGKERVPRAVVRRGRFTLGPVDLQIDWAERVAVTSPNGSGKTTLLGALLGRIPLDEGHAALGLGVVVGEVDQARGLFLGGEPLIDAFRTAGPDMMPADARTLLAQFGLRDGQGTPRRARRGGASRFPVSRWSAPSPARTARTSPIAGSWLAGSGSGRCAWIW
jgi:energy-coupling factor transporter ATP-binding protein EcfA2